MGRELEWKYAADAAALEAVARDHPGPWETWRMESRYLDTAEGDLARRRWTLRLRRENDETVLCLKTPLPGGGRGEWEVPGGDAARAVEQLLAAGAPAELADLLAGRTLTEVCGAAFTRRALAVDTGGGRAELALDRGQLTGGGRTEPLCELELEYKSGDVAAAEALAETLRLRYGLTPEPRSKFVRARALAEG